MQTPKETLQELKKTLDEAIAFILTKEINAENKKLISAINTSEKSLLQLLDPQRVDKTPELEQLIASILDAKKRITALMTKQQEELRDIYQSICDELVTARVSLLPAVTEKEPELTVMEIFLIENKVTKTFTKTKASIDQYRYTNFELQEFFSTRLPNEKLNDFSKIIKELALSNSNNALFACQLLINLDAKEFKDLLNGHPNIFINIREKLQHSQDPLTLLTLITLETRVFNVNNPSKVEENHKNIDKSGKMGDEFSTIRNKLNQHLIGKEKLDITSFNDDLLEIRAKAPSFLSRLISAFFSLFSKSKPKSFFEEQSAAKLINKVADEENKENFSPQIK